MASKSGGEGGRREDGGQEEGKGGRGENERSGRWEGWKGGRLSESRIFRGISIDQVSG